LRKNYFEGLLRDKGRESESFTSPFRATSELNMYIDAFEREFCIGDSKDEHKLRHLTALICDELIDSCTEDNSTDIRISSGYQTGIRSAATYINNNYFEPLSLDELAKMCGFSRNYFTTNFRQMFGVTPHVYLTKLRILKATQLLKTTTESVMIIARNCGYTKLNTFTQAFKSITDMNPTEFRNSL
jgi:AraC-like DNA-binding protein